MRVENYRNIYIYKKKENNIFTFVKVKAFFVLCIIVNMFLASL